GGDDRRPADGQGGQVVVVGLAGRPILVLVHRVAVGVGNVGAEVEAVGARHRQAGAGEVEVERRGQAARRVDGGDGVHAVGGGAGQDGDLADVETARAADVDRLAERHGHVVDRRQGGAAGGLAGDPGTDVVGRRRQVEVHGSAQVEAPAGDGVA